MEESLKACLYDILKSIEEIEGYFVPGLDTFVHYSGDIKTKRAVERNLEIIGEAMVRILKLNSQFELSNSKKIIATRNRIIHGYDVVSDELIWGIVVNHLPLLKNEVLLHLDTTS